MVGLATGRWGLTGQSPGFHVRICVHWWTLTSRLVADFRYFRSLLCLSCRSGEPTWGDTDPEPAERCAAQAGR